MSAVASIENGPAARRARRADIEAQIGLAEARAKRARESASRHRRKAKGGQGWHAGQAAIHEAVADRQAQVANRLRLKLAKDEAAQAKWNARHARRVAGSTAAAGLVPKAPGQPGPPKVANPGHAARPQAKGASKQDFVSVLTDCVRDAVRAKPTQPKGTPTMTAVSGEAVDLEQANATLDQLDALAADLRSATENASGSLASGGLAKVAGALSSGDDALESFQAALAEARQNLAPHQNIAEAVQAAGEMHNSPAFYGA